MLQFEVTSARDAFSEGIFAKKDCEDCKHHANIMHLSLFCTIVPISHLSIISCFM
jgi:hypothetical protein